MGGNKKMTGSKKSQGAAVPTFCTACKKEIYMSLTLATEHIKECKKRKEIEARDRQRAEALRAQALEGARAGRRG
jgi:hypothetical protein